MSNSTEAPLKAALVLTGQCSGVWGVGRHRLRHPSPTSVPPSKFVSPSRTPDLAKRALDIEFRMSDTLLEIRENLSTGSGAQRREDPKQWVRAFASSLGKSHFRSSGPWNVLTRSRRLIAQLPLFTLHRCYAWDRPRCRDARYASLTCYRLTRLAPHGDH